MSTRNPAAEELELLPAIFGEHEFQILPPVFGRPSFQLVVRGGTGDESSRVDEPLTVRLLVTYTDRKSVV